MYWGWDDVLFCLLYKYAFLPSISVKQPTAKRQTHLVQNAWGTEVLRGGNARNYFPDLIQLDASGWWDDEGRLRNPETGTHPVAYRQGGSKLRVRSMEYMLQIQILHGTTFEGFLIGCAQVFWSVFRFLTFYSLLCQHFWAFDQTVGEILGRVVGGICRKVFGAGFRRIRGDIGSKKISATNNSGARTNSSKLGKRRRELSRIPPRITCDCVPSTCLPLS